MSTSLDAFDVCVRKFIIIWFIHIGLQHTTRSVRQSDKNKSLHTQKVASPCGTI